MKFPWYIWIPRVALVVLIVYAATFSWEGNAPAYQKLIGNLIYNLPALFQLLILFFTWRKPLIAGIILLVMAVAATFALVSYRSWVDFFTYTVPLLVTGILFILIYLFIPKAPKPESNDVADSKSTE
jgi:hypothetical protein